MRIGDAEFGVGPRVELRSAVAEGHLGEVEGQALAIRHAGGRPSRGVSSSPTTSVITGAACCRGTTSIRATGVRASRLGQQTSQNSQSTQLLTACTGAITSKPGIGRSMVASYIPNLGGKPPRCTNTKPASNERVMAPTSVTRVTVATTFGASTMRSRY